MPEQVEPRQDFLQRFFWPIAFGVLVLLVVVVVVTIRWIQDSDRSEEAELNANYVERIEVRSTPAGGGSYRDLIVIDGANRYDCAAKDGRLSCADDPQPTPE